MEVGRILFSLWCISLFSLTSEYIPIRDILPKELKKKNYKSKLNDLHADLFSKEKLVGNGVLSYQKMEESWSLPQAEELSCNEEDSYGTSSIEQDLASSLVTETESELSTDDEASVSEKLTVPEECRDHRTLNSVQDPTCLFQVQNVPSSRDREEAMRLLREYQNIQILKIKEARKKLGKQKKALMKKSANTTTASTVAAVSVPNKRVENRINSISLPTMQKSMNVPLFNTETLPTIRYSSLKPLAPGIPSRTEETQRYVGFADLTNGIWSVSC